MEMFMQHVKCLRHLFLARFQKLGSPTIAKRLWRTRNVSSIVIQVHATFHTDTHSLVPKEKAEISETD